MPGDVYSECVYQTAAPERAWQGGEGGRGRYDDVAVVASGAAAGGDDGGDAAAGGVALAALAPASSFCSASVILRTLIQKKRTMTLPAARRSGTGTTVSCSNCGGQTAAWAGTRGGADLLL